MLGALGLLMLASLARAFTGSIAALFLATIAIGAGIALAGVLVAGFVKASFPARPALFMSVYATALALGSTVAAAATGAIVAAHAGWRLGAGIWALPALAALLAWLLLPFRRAAPAPAAAGPAQDGMPLRNRTAWLVALFFAANNFVFYACIAWLAPMYVEAGWAPARASLLLATFTIAFMAANPLFGYFSRSEDRRALLGLGAGIALAGVLALMIAPMAAPFLTVAVLAFGTGGAFTLSMTLPLDNTRTPEETSAWNAFVMLVSYSIAAVGPVAVGQLRDASGSFHGAHLMLAAVSALMLALTPFLQPHRPQAIGGLAPAM
jgi:CP family cyanate transporter-like MFS transporter